MSSFSLAQTPFFAPPNGALGDTFPFFHHGACHLFALQPPHVAHFVSEDLINWETWPVAVLPGAPGEPDAGMIATGTVVEHDARFYLFYTAGPAQTICLATSNDLTHWAKHSANPIVTAATGWYAAGHWRDPYVFFNRAEGCWWMLLGARVRGRPGPRSGCVGLAKSTDLLSWQCHAPLWAPGIGPHCDCPQLVEHDRRWYLLYLQRNTRYRIAAGPRGPFARPPTRDLGTMYAAAGSRPVCDGRRWISFPFVVGMEHERDLGNWQYGGPLAVPRELHFTPGGDIHERPLAELVATLNLLPALSSELQRPRPLVGHWDTSEAGVVVCRSDAGGTLLLPNLPGNLYLEAEVVLPPCRRWRPAHVAAARLDTRRATHYPVPGRWNVPPNMAAAARERPLPATRPRSRATRSWPAP